jgi:hypothetical protein
MVGLAIRRDIIIQRPCDWRHFQQGLPDHVKAETPVMRSPMISL